VSDLTHSEYVGKIQAWLHAEITQFREVGATEDDIRELAFKQMLGERFVRWFKTEFRDHPEAWQFMWDEFMRSGSPDALRWSAERLRCVGELDSAYDLEALADHREH
jgi:hypothetical protein